MPEVSSTVPNLTGLRSSASQLRRPGTAGTGMHRPVSAPHLLLPASAGPIKSSSGAGRNNHFPGVTGGTAKSRGFATTISPSPSVSGSTTGSPSKSSEFAVPKSFAGELLSRLDARDLAALSMVDLLDPPESAAIDPPPLSEPLQARRKGTDHWLARNFDAAAEQFLHMANLYSDGTPARSQALRMRAAALMRSRRFEEALSDANAALQCLGQPAADPSTDRDFFERVAHTGASADALACWQLHGVAQEAMGKYQEATLSISRALLLACVGAAEANGSKASPNTAAATSAVDASAAADAAAQRAKRRSELFGSGSPALAASSLLTHFLSAAARAHTSLLPLQVYVTMPTSDAQRAARAGGLSSQQQLATTTARPGTAPAALTHVPTTSAAPAFRLVLRPRFTPWPLDLQVGDVPGVEIEGGTRLAFYCAYKQMPAEPHACLMAHHKERSALVLLSVRIDGQLEVLSNSSEAAWDQVQALLGQPPQLRSLHDFDVVSAGWTSSGVSVATFAALVAQKWSEWEVGRGKAAAKRKEEEKELLRRQEALREWLCNLGLEELHER